MTAVQMWKEYRELNPSAKAYEAWAFGGGTPEMSNFLADLVKRGIKTATASAYPCYVVEEAPLPQVGSYHIVLDTQEEAVCIIQIKNVHTIPFCQVTEEHAWKEGEFERTLASWRTCHEKFFREELAAIGQEFTEEMLVVCETFEVVYPKCL